MESLNQLNSHANQQKRRMYDFALFVDFLLREASDWWLARVFGATPVNIQPIAVHVLASDGSHFGMICSSMYYAYYLSI